MRRIPAESGKCTETYRIRNMIDIRGAFLYTSLKMSFRDRAGWCCGGCREADGDHYLQEAEL